MEVHFYMKKRNVFSQKEAMIFNNFDLRQTKYRLTYWLLFLFMLILSIAIIVPLIWTVMMGFKESSEIYAIPNSFFPKKFVFSSVSEAWKTLQIGRSIINTVAFAAGQIFFTVFVAALGGYVLSRLKPTGSSFVFALISFSMMLPGEVRVIPTFMELINLPLIGISLKNTYFSMWILAAANAFNVLLFKNYFDSISISLIEAAKLDGCTNFKIFYKIVVPLSMPIIIFVAISANNGAWGGFFWPMLMLDDTKKWILPLTLYKRSADTQLNLYFMGLTFSMIPTFLIFLIFQKYIMGGINVGGVKG